MSESLIAHAQKAAIESVLGNIDLVDKTLYWKLVERIEELEQAISRSLSELDRETARAHLIVALPKEPSP